MPISPRFSVCLKAKGTKFVFTDTTGLYNATSNPNGWRGPNEDGDDVVSSFFRITTPSGEIYDHVVTPYFPMDVEGDIQFPAFEGDWEDGIYTFEYRLNTGNTYNTCLKKVFTPNIDCCLDNEIKEYIDDLSCSNCPASLDEFMKLGTYRDMLHIISLTKNEKQINNILEYLKKFCNLDNC